MFTPIRNMGKKNFRSKGARGGKSSFGKRDSGNDGRGGSWTELARENAKWEQYYRAMGIVPEAEWATFKKHCQEALPLTFRITGLRAHAREINDNFRSHVARLRDATFEGVPLQPKNLAYYPDELGWQIDVSKSVVRKNEEFAKTQRWLVIETEVGNILRQEAVLMIPPLLMDIAPHHAVLDMCAAPGSKTAQLVEALHAQGDASGFVLANDLDYKRSHMLVHQVKRLNLPNFMVVNHDAQLFPRIRVNGAAEYLRFDRILCDVPCLGDGTMRKNVNVWKDFTVGNALGLHLLQVNILQRGLQLLKRGGRLVYLTCSLLPVENEAVVAAALRKWDDVKVVDCSAELPGLVRREGISRWPVFGKDMEERQPGAEDVAQTCFPPTHEEAARFGLERCLRVYPHLQNTGGFFIAVLEKAAAAAPVEAGAAEVAPASTEVASGVVSEVAPEVAPEVASASTKRSADSPAPEAKKAKTEAAEASEAASSGPSEAVGSGLAAAAPPNRTSGAKRERLPRDANEEPFIFLPPDHPELAKCWDFYDFSPSFRKDCTLVRNALGTPLRTIYYVAPVIKDILTIDDQKLKIVHAGVKLFVAQKNDLSNCAWRVQNEALHAIKDYLGSSRHLACNLTLLERLFQEAFPKINAIKESGIDPEFSARLELMADGCVFLTVKRDGLEDLFLPLWKGRTNVNLMVNKKDTHELLYRVFGIETTAKDAGKEAIYQKKLEAPAAKAAPVAETAPAAETVVETAATDAAETAAEDADAAESK